MSKNSLFQNLELLLNDSNSYCAVLNMDAEIIFKSRQLSEKLNEYAPNSVKTIDDFVKTKSNTIKNKLQKMKRNKYSFRVFLFNSIKVNATLQNYSTKHEKYFVISFDHIDKSVVKTIDREIVKTLINFAPAGIIVVNPDYKVEYVNSVFCKIFSIQMSNLENYDIRKNPRIAVNELIEDYKKYISGKVKNGKKVYHVKDMNDNDKVIEVYSRFIKDPYGNYHLVSNVIDITESFLKLVDSESFENKVRTLFRKGTYVIYRLNKKLEVEYMSPSVKNTLGYNASEACGHHVSEYLSQEFNEDAFLPIEKLEQNKTYISKFKVITKHGDERWIENTYILNNALNKSDKSISGIFSDISQNVEFENELKEKTEFQEIISNISARIVNATDENLLDEIFYALKEIGEYKGYLSSYFMLFSDDLKYIKCISEWNLEEKRRLVERLDMAPTSDRKWWLRKMKKLKPLYIKSLDDIPNSESIWRTKLKSFNFNGVPLESFLHVPINYQGKLLGFLGLSSNKKNVIHKNDDLNYYKIIGGIIANAVIRKNFISELKSSENRYKKLFNNSSVGIFQVTNEGNIAIANDAFYQTLGYAISRNGKQKQIEKDIKFYKRKSDRNKFLKLLDQQSSIDNFETEFYKHDGRTIDVQLSGKVLCNNPLAKYEIVILDITAKKSAEKALVSAKEKAENSEKLKSEFLAQMSHEIRTPINTILSFSEFLRDELHGLINDDLKNSFDLMNNAGKRIIRTVDLLLNTAEVQTGTYSPLYKTVDLKQNVIQPLFYEFKDIAKSKNVDLKINSSIRNTLLLADEYTLIQIFQNLLDNAVKFTNQGFVSIDISKKIQNNLTVEIKDSGIGISKEYLPKLFETFSQEEQGYTRKYDGNGLGLALVNKYCEINNAFIKVNSKKNRGTSFTVVFNKPK